MRVVMFYHSLVSDWNHGNAHFLRGVVQELRGRGHDVHVYEPKNGWSRSNLVRDYGERGVEAFARAYPDLRSELYDPDAIDLNAALAGADLVLVHEWNDPRIVAAIGLHRALHPGYRLLFHDTHHRSVTRPEEMESFDLRHYDGVLAFGDSIRDRYFDEAWAARVWTWHEAADTNVFAPIERTDGARGDLVWVGNWGDEERTAEIEEFLLAPSKALGLSTVVYGVRYPDSARRLLADYGVAYAGWIPNADVPALFARFTVTVHIPRRPYLESLPGVPTIRVFEALACGIPLISARWDQAADLFTPGEDFLVAGDGAEMTQQLARVLADESLRARLAANGRAAILARHTCRHRVDQLLAICTEIPVTLEEPVS